ncbi:MAG: FIST N-terminal domain-containing protein [Mariprofundales bacterium]|nr:FIST N-terminal domain-containing protein [Mariprofundales bacterium]
MTIVESFVFVGGGTLHILTGQSHANGADAALSAAVSSWPDSWAPDLVLVFHAACYDSAAIAAGIAARFPDALVAGASTAGEWFDAHHCTGSLVLTAIASDQIHFSLTVAEQLTPFGSAEAMAVSARLLQPLGLLRGQLNPQRHFLLSFFDGLCQREEPVIAAMRDALGGVQMVGGSSGDSLRFADTPVIANGDSYHNAAVFVLADSAIPFDVCKHQHFVATEISTVITAVDDAARRIVSLDGYPAAERYAELLGLEIAALDTEVFARHPLIYQLGDHDFVRSLAHANSDGSLQAHTAVESGMILALGEPHAMVECLRQECEGWHGEGALLLLFNCALRTVESDLIDASGQLAQLLATKSCLVVGFDTFGEQFAGLHVNQTAVMLRLGTPKA